MKLRYKNIENSKRLFEIEVSPEMVKKKYDQVCEEVKKNAHVPGYRTGKAPKEILEKFHGKKIKEEAMQDLIAHSYRQALDQSKTDTVGLPEISDLNFDLEKGLSFKIRVDVRPGINLKKYKNLVVKKQKIEVKPGDADRYLSVLRESKAGFHDVPHRPVRMGDYIVCDLECLVEGKPIYPKRQGVWILADKNNPVPGLIEGLMGRKSGENFEIKTVLPENFQEIKYRNKEALFKISLLKVKEKHLPNLDDEFAKNLGGYNNLEDLKKAINIDLARKLEDRIRQDMENQILEQLLKEAKFSVPSDLLERETKRLVELRKKESGKPGEEKLQETAREDAARRVKLYFILDEIAKQEKISVNNEELDSVLDSLAKEYGKTRDELSQYYRKNNLLEGLKDQLRENKVVEFLINSANIS